MEVDEVQRQMKFSVTFLVQQSSRWANPRTSATSLAALPEGKLLPLPAASLSHPLGRSSGMLPKAEPRRQMEREGAESNLQNLCLSHRQSQGVLACLTPAFSLCVGAEGTLCHHPRAWLARQGEPLSPRLLGGGGGSRIPGSAMGQMKKEDLCRSCWFIINCWRT